VEFSPILLGESFRLSQEKVKEAFHVHPLDLGSHIGLPYIHREAVEKADPLNALFLGPAFGQADSHGGHPLANEGALLQYIIFGANGPVSRDDMVGLQRSQKVQRPKPALRVRGMKPGLTFAEDRVPRKYDPLLGNVDGDLPSGVPGGVEELKDMIPQAKGEPCAEGDGRQVRSESFLLGQQGQPLGIVLLCDPRCVGV